MQLFYNPALSEDGEHFTFPEDESKHIVKVLRKKNGDKLHITNGKGDFFDVLIDDAHPKKCTAKVISKSTAYRKRHRYHLAVAPPKSIDRFEWILEKATEIGVHEITPIICNRSERKTIKQERSEKVVQAAMKQSLRAFLPKFNPPTSFSDFLDQERNGLLFIAHCDERGRLDFKRKIAPDHDITVLIGPEGDFSPDEIRDAEDKGFLSVSLGESRLRTETAALVATTVVNSVNNS